MCISPLKVALMQKRPVPSLAWVGAVELFKTLLVVVFIGKIVGH